MSLLELQLDRPPSAMALRVPIFAAVDLGNEGKHFEQARAVGCASTDIEHLASQRGHVGLGQEEGVHQIFDEQDVADLIAVAIEGDRLTLKCQDP